MRDNLNYDVMIVGAGPAGCFSACNLNSRFKVLLVDRSRLPRSKSCGGVLKAEVLELLKEHGAEPPSDIFRTPRILKVEGLDWDHNLRVQEKHQYTNADRDKFDQWLLRLAEEHKNVDVWPQTRFVSVKRDIEGKVRSVTLKKDDETLEVATKYLIGADGANSRVRKIVTTHTPAKYFTLQEEIKLNGTPNIDGFIGITRKDIDFYVWVIPKGDRLIIGAGFNSESKGAKEKFEQLAEKAKEDLGVKGEVIGSLKGCHLLNIRSVKDVSSGKGNVFLVGEAAGLVAPTTGEGISYALKSGKYCAQAINNGSGNPLRYYESSVSSLKKYLRSQIVKRRMLSNVGARVWLYRLHPRAKVTATLK